MLANMDLHMKTRCRPVGLDGGTVSRTEVVVDKFPELWDELAGIHAEV
jgi:hypothetical protein